MKKLASLRLFPWMVCLATCFGVFVLPFFFPSNFVSAVSVSNLAGFNNKVAAMAAGLCAVAVFVVAYLDPRGDRNSIKSRDPAPLSRLAVAGMAFVVSGLIAFLSWLVFLSKERYESDLGYFVNQLSSYALYHRQLYSQIEFPYGPLLFYPAILLHSLLTPWHISLKAAYLVMLVLNHVVGVLLLGYLVNSLPINRSLKVFALVCFALFSVQPELGLNYTLFRFVTPVATLVSCARRRKPLTVAILFTLDQILNLALSPEMGFAFAAGSIFYALLKVWHAGRAWLPAVLGPPLGCALFLLLVGSPYLRMLGLFARGSYNFIVEPLPHVLVLLFAAVWLVPRMLATRLRQGQDDALLLGSCFFLSLALLPVAFGRADAGHVFFNGITMFLLSLVAIGSYPRWKRLIWLLCVAGAMLLGYARGLLVWQANILNAVFLDAVHYPQLPLSQILIKRAERAKAGAVDRLERRNSPSPIDTTALRSIVGNDTVATPYVISVLAEEQLIQAGLYRPDFYFFMGFIDSAGEDRKIREFNEARYALLPTGVIFTYSEDQHFADQVMGIPLPYRLRREPYVVGRAFAQNLETHWHPVAQLGDYTVYQRTL